MSAEAEQQFQEDLAHIVSPASRQFYDIVKLAATYAAETVNDMLRTGVPIAVHDADGEVLYQGEAQLDSQGVLRASSLPRRTLHVDPPAQSTQDKLNEYYRGRGIG